MFEYQTSKYLYSSQLTNKPNSIIHINLRLYTLLLLKTVNTIEEISPVFSFNNHSSFNYENDMHVYKADVTDEDYKMLDNLTSLVQLNSLDNLNKKCLYLDIKVYNFTYIIFKCLNSLVIAMYSLKTRPLRK